MKTMGQNIQTRIIAAALVFVMVFASIVSAGLAVNVDFGDFLSAMGFGTNKNSSTNLSTSGDTPHSFVNDYGNYGYEITSQKNDDLVLDGERDYAYDYAGITISAAHNMPANSGSTFDVSFAATGRYVYFLYEFTKEEGIFYPDSTDTNGLGNLHWFDCVDFCLDLTGAGVAGKEFHIMGKYEGDKTTAKINANPATAGVENWFVKHTDKGYNVEFIIPMTSVSLNDDGSRELCFTALSTITTSYTSGSAPARVYTTAISSVGLDKNVPSTLVINDGHKLEDGRYKYTLEEATEALNPTADGVKDDAYDSGLFFVNLFNTNVTAVPNNNEKNRFELYVAADKNNVYFFYDIKDELICSENSTYYYNDCAELVWNLTGAAKSAADVRIYGVAEGVDHYESGYNADYMGAITTAKSTHGLKSYAVKHTEDGYTVEYVIDRSNMAFGNIMAFLPCATFSTSNDVRSYTYGANSANDQNSKKDTLNVLEIVPAGYEDTFVQDNSMQDEYGDEVYSTPDYKLEGGSRWGYFLYASENKLVTDGYRDVAYKSGVRLINKYNRTDFDYEPTPLENNTFEVFIAADDEKVNILFEVVDDKIIIDADNPDTEAREYWWNDAVQFCLKSDGTANNGYDANGNPVNAPTVTTEFGAAGPRVIRGTIDGITYRGIVVRTEKGYNMEFSFNREDILDGNVFSFMGLATITDSTEYRTYGFIDNGFKNATDINKKNLHQFQILDKVDLNDSKYNNILKDAGTSGTEARWQFYLDATDDVIYNDGYLDPAYLSGLKFDNHANRDAMPDTENGNTYTVYLAADYDKLSIFYEITDNNKYADNVTQYKNDCIHFRLDPTGSKNANAKGTTNIYAADGQRSGTFKIDTVEYEYTLVYTEKGYNVEISTDRSNIKKDTFSFVGSVSLAWYEGNSAKNTYGFTNTTNGTAQDTALNYYANQIVIVDELPAAVKGDISDIYTSIDAPVASGSSSMLFETIANNPTAVAVVYPKEAPVVTMNLAQAVATATGGTLYQEGASGISGKTYKIYVGYVMSATEVKTMVNTMSYGKYGVAVYGNSVVILGPTEQTLTKAVDLFKNELAGSVGANTFYSGTSAAVAGFELPWIDNARLLTDTGFGNYMLIKANSNLTAFEAYCDSLTAAGYKLHSSNIMDGYYYSKIFYNTTEIVNVTFGLHYTKFFEVNGTYKFTASDIAGTANSLRVNVSSRAVFDLPINDVESYDKYTDTVFVQLSTDSSNLCDIVRLDTGEFIIFDSAHHDKTDEIMGELLALSNGEKPVVRAWFITHFHQDHIGGLSSLSNIKNIADKIEIQNVVMNLGSEYTYSTAWNKTNPSTGDKRNMENLLAGLDNCGTKLIFTFAGQVYNIGNASVEVLYTYSDSQPMNISVDSTNRTNTGYALTLLEDGAEQKFIITGDSSFEQFNLAAKRYESYLKADVLQIPHHGYGEYGYASSGGTKGGEGYNSVMSFYNAVNPKYIIIPWTTLNADGSREGRKADSLPNAAEKEIIASVEAAGGKYLYNNGRTLRLSIPYGDNAPEVGFTSDGSVLYYDSYYNNTAGEQNEDDGVNANPNDKITFPVGSAESGSYIYVANTAYTDITTDGVMEDIYTYGIHLKNDKSNSSACDVTFDVYIIAGQDGKIHVFYDVKDTARHNYTVWGTPNYSYRQDGIDFYFGLAGDGTYNTDIRIVGKNSSGATRFETQNAYYSGNNKSYFGEGKMFSDFVVVENSQGYTVEFSIDRNGELFENGDRLTFAALANSIITWNSNTDHTNCSTGPDSYGTSAAGAYLAPDKNPTSQNILIFSSASAVEAAAEEAALYGTDDTTGKYTGEIEFDTAIIGSVSNTVASPQLITGINTVYTVPTIDGVMDDIYTYGIYTETKYNSNDELNAANPHSFKAWMVYAEDGKMHVYIEVKDANILLGATDQWKRDSIHFYYALGNSNKVTGTFAFDANATTQGSNHVPDDYFVTLTEDGYNIEFSFDRKGTPFRPGDTFEYCIYQNCVYGVRAEDANDPYRYNSQSGSYWAEERAGLTGFWTVPGGYISPNGGNFIHFDGVKIMSRESATALIVDGCAHNMVAGATTAPDCENEGYTVYTCSYCGYTENDDYVDALGHDYNAVVTAPDCDNDGYTTYTCTVCGDTYVADEVVTEGHKYDAVVTAPTCTTGGYTTYTCSVCGDTYVDDEVAAEGHKYDAVVTDPTCTTGGYTTYTCSVCGDTYVADEVATEGHKYDAVVTAPTCTTNGYTTYTCSVCGDSYVGDEVATEGHSFGDDCACTVCGTKCTHNFDSNNVCTICGMEKFVFQTSMQAYLNLEDVVTMSVGYKTTNIANINAEDYLERLGLLIWYTDSIEDADATYENSDVVVTNTVYNAVLGRFETTTDGIPAKMLGDAMCFRAYFINADGTYSYGRVIQNYSAKKYCYSQLNKAVNSGDTRTENLMLAILNYGAAAQEYFSYNTDNLMNSDLTEAQKTIAWDDSYVRSSYNLPKTGMDAAFVRSSSVTSRGAYLNLEGAIDISFYGKVSFTPVTATIYYWVESDIQSLDKLTLENAHSSEEMEWNDTLSRWEGKFEGQPAKAMFDTVFCCMVFTDSNGNVHYSGVVGYSPERYGYTNRNKGGTTQNLARCLVNYGKAAVEYFGE